MRREDRAARLIAAALLVATAAGVGLFVVYLGGGQTQLEGTLLAVAFGGIALALGVWATVLLREPPVVEERPPMASRPEDRRLFQAVLGRGLEEADIPRRRALVRLLGAAVTTLGVALLLPFRSLGPGPRRELFTTGWRRGVRLVTADGQPLRPEDVVADQVITVFPEGADEHARADSQALLIGVRPGTLELPPDAPPTPPNIVVYSKICTHAGCPVGLFRAAVGELLCPCHQSTFDVHRGARVTSGPAGRPLPQLPVGVDGQGYLIALGDFPTPVGPAFWNMTRGGGR